MKALDKEKALLLISTALENYEVTSVSIDNGINDFAIDGFVHTEYNDRRTIMLELREKSDANNE